MDINRLIEFGGNHSLLVMALVAILSMLVADTLRRKLSGIVDIDSREATRLLNTENAVMIDIRGDKDFRSNHIINAVHLENPQNAAAKLEKLHERPLIVYCNSGQRSVSVCGKLRKQGFPRVYNLKGGLHAWQKAELPLSRS